MTKYVARRVRGVNKLRRTLNRLEPNSKKKVASALRWGAMEIEKDAIGLALMHDLKLTGDMIQSIEYQMANDGFTAVIGPSAKNARVRKNPFNTSQYSGIKAPKRASTLVRDKDAQWNLMKAWWAEFGTEGPIEQDPKPFMNPAYFANAKKIKNKVDAAVVKELKKLASGPT